MKTKCMLAKNGQRDASTTFRSTCPPGWLDEYKEVDGYRGLVRRRREFYSRAGKMFNTPELYKKAFPKEDLDGEYWCGRDQQDFQYMGVVRKGLLMMIGQVISNMSFMIYQTIQGPLKKDSNHFKKIVKDVRRKVEKDKQSHAKTIQEYPMSTCDGRTNQDRIRTTS